MIALSQWYQFPVEYPEESDRIKLALVSYFPAFTFCSVSCLGSQADHEMLLAKVSSFMLL